MPGALLAIFLAASLLGIVPIATAQDSTGDETFATPEEAITFFMQGVTQGDVSQIMQACAVDEMTEKFSFDLYTNRIGYLTISSPAPSDYPFYAEMNRALFTSQILNQVKNLAYGLLATEKATTEGRTVPMDPAGTIQFREEVNPERLAQLQVVAMGLPAPEMANTERNLNNWHSLAQVYGADEFTERVVLLLFEGDYYYIGFMLLRYGENWKISSAASSLGNTNFNGTPLATTEEGFHGLIGSQ
jgi:hypothetical protein